MRLGGTPRICLAGMIAATMVIAFRHDLQAQQQTKPNIVVIFGDDIGYWNVGAYTHGMMGWTPNIDRIAKEGILFTDHYGQPSCTAGRAAYIMGQMPIRTGETTVGIPGSTRGIQKEDPTLNGGAQIARLCDCAVWKEPPWGPQRVSTHCSWLRRVVWKPIPTECTSTFTPNVRPVPQ